MCTYCKYALQILVHCNTMLLSLLLPVYFSFNSIEAWISKGFKVLYFRSAKHNFY